MTEPVPGRIPEFMRGFELKVLFIENALAQGTLKIGPQYIIPYGLDQTHSLPHNEITISVAYTDSEIPKALYGKERDERMPCRDYYMFAHDGSTILGFKNFYLRYNNWQYAITHPFATTAYRGEKVGSAIELSMTHLLALWRENEGKGAKINRKHETGGLVSQAVNAGKIALYGDQRHTGKVDYDTHNSLTSGVEMPFSKLDAIELRRDGEFPSKLVPQLAAVDYAIELDEHYIQERRRNVFQTTLLPILKQAAAEQKELYGQQSSHL